MISSALSGLPLLLDPPLSHATSIFVKMKSAIRGRLALRDNRLLAAIDLPHTAIQNTFGVSISTVRGLVNGPEEY